MSENETAQAGATDRKPHAPIQLPDTAEDLVRELYSAFLSQDRATLDALLDDDFIFNSPKDDHIDKAAWFERCFPNAGEFHSFAIEQLFVEGDEALVRYYVELKDGSTFRNAEYVRLAAGRIEEVDVFFGATLVQG